MSLGLLGFFKYTNFLLGLVWPVIRPLGASSDPPFLKIILPLGISFYTFETISYVVDVYRRRIPAERKLLNYMLFLMFFPHLIAGPIVRPGDFLPQLERLRNFDWSRVELGARLFLLGLLKKAVIADQLAQVVDPIYAAPAGFGSATLWAATVAYAIQIYCDFSGYSDMAIGCAHAFGLKLPMNFNLPYLSQNVAEVWTRWHISFSTWLRDYLYIPLGGNRGGQLAACRNILLTMLLGGLWHGAGWTYVCWGLSRGLFLQFIEPCPCRAGWATRPLRPYASQSRSFSGVLDSCSSVHEASRTQRSCSRACSFRPRARSSRPRSPWFLVRSRRCFSWRASPHAGWTLRGSLGALPFRSRQARLRWGSSWLSPLTGRGWRLHLLPVLTQGRDERSRSI